jgi:signal transduction histidine kinase
VKHIRSAIFGLETSLAGNAEGLRTRLLALVRESDETLGFEPRMLFDGPIDTAVDDRRANDLVATLREALSNAARHAQASQVDVAVIANDGELRLTVTDDGVGPPLDRESRGGHGVRNMAARAAAFGGSAELRPGAVRGAVLTWRVPLA